MLDKATTRRSALLTVHPRFGLFWLDRLIEGSMSDWRYVESNRQEPRNVDLNSEVPYFRPAAQDQL